VDEQRRALLAKHGYDPDLRPRGVSGGPERVFAGMLGGRQHWLRNWVCQLDGVLIDGHEGNDLDPGETICIQCGHDWGEDECDD
jgi:hypothetical protein